MLAPLLAAVLLAVRCRRLLAPRALGWWWLSAAVAAGLPLMLCAALGLRSLSAAGQFTLWWSLPWAAGLALAALPDPAPARRAARLTVACSVLLAVACGAAPLLHAPPLRLPDGPATRAP